jgi:hypothetical protein
MSLLTPLLLWQVMAVRKRLWFKVLLLGQGTL